MEVMLRTQEDLKQGNQKINNMLQEMETKKASTPSLSLPSHRLDLGLGNLPL